MPLRMRCWFTVTALIIQCLVRGNAIADDDAVILLMDNKPAEKSETTDIEARRRSALDKNFMRFGRSGGGGTGVDYIPFGNNAVLRTAEDDDRDEQRFRRGKQDSFIRFGRGKSSDFIRFGRALGVRQTRGGKENNFIRFGKRDNDFDFYDDDEFPVQEDGGSRFRRDISGDSNNNKNVYFSRSERSPSGRNLIRFGRKDNFMRFGRNNVEEPNLNGDKEQNADPQKKLLNDDDCSACALGNIFVRNRFLSRFQHFPVWPQLTNDLSTIHKNVKKLNTIRFG